jgi:hypothetical protein
MKPTYEEWKTKFMNFISKLRGSELTSDQMKRELLAFFRSNPRSYSYFSKFYLDTWKSAKYSLIKGIAIIFFESLLFKNKEELSSVFIKSFLSKNEEWRGFISEQKYGWRKAGLTKQQINMKVLIFFFELYWGRFKTSIKLLRILSWVKIR